MQRSYDAMAAVHTSKSEASDESQLPTRGHHCRRKVLRTETLESTVNFTGHQQELFAHLSRASRAN